MKKKTKKGAAAKQKANFVFMCMKMYTGFEEVKNMDTYVPYISADKTIADSYKKAPKIQGRLMREIQKKLDSNLCKLNPL